MALVVEDGTGKANAEAYASVAEADAYFAARDPEATGAWFSISEGQKEAALRKGADYMQSTYAARWKGYKITRTQALDWPRQLVYEDQYVLDTLADQNLIPVEVKRANIELAARSLSSELLIDVEPTVVRESVGPIAIEYDRNAPAQTQFAAVDAMLSRYLVRSGAVVRVERS